MMSDRFTFINPCKVLVEGTKAPESQDYSCTGFNNDYEDLRTITSADAHGCTSS